MNLDLNDLRRLLRILEKRNVAEFEFEDDKVRLRLVRGGVAAASAAHFAVAAAPVATVPVAGVAAPVLDEAGTVYVTSPFVGTFYRSPSPDAPPFVEPGSAIREGQALCLVAAGTTPRGPLRTRDALSALQAPQASVPNQARLASMPFTVLVKFDGRPLSLVRKLCQ